MLNSDRYQYNGAKESEDEEDDEDTTTSNASPTKNNQRKKRALSHHHHRHHNHHYMSKSSTLPKPLKGILKNKPDQQLIMDPNSELLLEDKFNLLKDTLYTQFPEMAFNSDQQQQQQQQTLPLNVLNYNSSNQHFQSNLAYHTLPRHLDVVPFDTVPPCDDCLKRARYKGSYGTECHGTSGAECVFMNNQETSSCLTSTFKTNASSKPEQLQMKNGNIMLI